MMKDQSVIKFHINECSNSPRVGTSGTSSTSGAARPTFSQGLTTGGPPVR